MGLLWYSAIHPHKLVLVGGSSVVFRFSSWAAVICSCFCSFFCTILLIASLYFSMISFSSSSLYAWVPSYSISCGSLLSNSYSFSVSIFFLSFGESTFKSNFLYNSSFCNLYNSSNSAKILSFLEFKSVLIFWLNLS